MAGPSERSVAEVMSRNPICIPADTTLRQLVQLFNTRQVSGFPVVDRDGKMVGVVSQTDLIRRCLSAVGSEPAGFFFRQVAAQVCENGNISSEDLIIVADIMTSEPITVTATEGLRTVAQKMYARRVHRVVVVDEKRKPVGIVTTMDVLGAMSKG